jgi:hypothetical protein
MEEEREYQWGAIVVPAIVIFAIGFFGQILIGAIYPTIIGFQTKGDNAAIQQAIVEMQSSPIMFVVALILLPALAGFWRGRALAAKIEYRPEIHAAAAGVLAAVIVFVLTLVLSRGNILGALQPLVMWGLCAGGGAFAGAKLVKKD